MFLAWELHAFLLNPCLLAYLSSRKVKENPQGQFMHISCKKMKKTVPAHCFQYGQHRKSKKMEAIVQCSTTSSYCFFLPVCRQGWEVAGLVDRLNYGDREMLNTFNKVKVKELTSISLVSSILRSCSPVIICPRPANQWFQSGLCLVLWDLLNVCDPKLISELNKSQHCPNLIGRTSIPEALVDDLLRLATYLSLTMWFWGKKLSLRS